MANNRPIRPRVVTTYDNPIAQVNCEPDRDEIDFHKIVQEIMARFELNIGTSFDLQIMTMDNTRMLAMRRYIVVEVKESFK